MSQQVKNRPADYARAIAKLVAKMPVERAAQLYDFARFLQAEALSVSPIELTEDDWLNDSEDQMQAEDELWEAARARHRAEFAALQENARAEIDAGITQPLFDANGDILADELAHDA
jgi:hypothetical protein